MKMNRVEHSVGLVAKTMQMMNSGFAVIFARNGFMGNV